MKRFFSRWLARWFGERDPRTPAASVSGAPVQADRTAAPPRGPMLDCDAVMRQLWDFLDGELNEERMAAIRAHLDICKRCYPQLEFEQSFLDAVAGTAPRHSDPERLRARVAERLQAIGLTEP